MELTNLQEEAQKKLNAVIKDAEENLKKIQEKAQPHIDELQENWKDSDWMIEKLGLKDAREKVETETKDALERGATWLDDQYSTVLETLGLATKDEVDSLRKKIAKIQRKLTDLNKKMAN